MRLLVTGGRAFMDRQAVNITLDEATKDVKHDELIVIHGCARGADDLADQWARKKGIHVARVPALWDSWPVSAGPNRNKAMLLLQPDLVVAFPGGSGTGNMVKLATQAGIKVVKCAR